MSLCHSVWEALRLHRSADRITWLGTSSGFLPGATLPGGCAGSIRMPNIVIYNSELDNWPVPVELTWDQLAAYLTQHTETPCTPTTCARKACPHKMGRAWSPAVHKPGTTRHNDHVTQITCAVFDLDHVTPESLAVWGGAFEGLDHFIYTTHNHRLLERDGAYRVVVRLAEPCPANLWAQVLALLIETLHIPADPSCKDLSRLYYMPTVPTGGERFACIESGAALDWRALLSAPRPAARTPDDGASSNPLPAGATFTAQDEEPEAFELEPVRDAIRERMGRLARSKRPGDDERSALLKRTLEGRALFTEAEGSLVGRSVSVNMLASLLIGFGSKIPQTTPDELLLELAHTAIARMECKPEGLSHWLGVFKTSLTTARKRRQQKDLEVKLARKAFEQEMANVFPGMKPPPRPDLDADEDPEESADYGADAAPLGDATVLSKLLALPDPQAETKALAEAEQENGWKRALIPGDPRKGDLFMPCSHNVTVILHGDTRVRNTIRFNAMTKEVEITGGPFAKAPASVLPATVTDWLQAIWQMHVRPQDVRDRILRVARLNEYDPLLEYLTKVGPTWDRVPRISTFLETYYGARVHDDMGRDHTDYVRKVSTRFLISMAARGLSPGAKVDNVLILEGLTGLKKSMGLEKLCGAFFTDTPVTMDQNGRMMTVSNWLVELGELVSLRKTDTDTAKNFFSAREDHFRVPYGATLERSKRRCVFVGTTNRAQYLVDPTGNRRYWPIHVDKVDVEGIVRDRDQILAEAVSRYYEAVDQTNLDSTRPSGERWWFEAFEYAQAAEAIETRMEDTPTTQLVSEWWLSLHVSKRIAYRIPQVAREALQIAPDRINKRVCNEIAQAMRDMGFVERVRREGKTTVRVYEPTDELVKMSRVGLQLINGGESPNENQASV